MICQFYRSKQRGISDSKCICICPCFGKAGKDQKGLSTHEASSLTEPLMQPLFVELLRRGRDCCQGCWLGDS